MTTCRWRFVREYMQDRLYNCLTIREDQSNHNNLMAMFRSRHKRLLAWGRWASCWAVSWSSPLSCAMLPTTTRTCPICCLMPISNCRQYGSCHLHNSGWDNCSSLVWDMKAVGYVCLNLLHRRGSLHCSATVCCRWRSSCGRRLRSRGIGRQPHIRQEGRDDDHRQWLSHTTVG